MLDPTSGKQQAFADSFAMRAQVKLKARQHCERIYLSSPLPVIALQRGCICIPQQAAHKKSAPSCEGAPFSIASNRSPNRLLLGAFEGSFALIAVSHLARNRVAIDCAGVGDLELHALSVDVINERQRVAFDRAG